MFSHGVGGGPMGMFRGREDVRGKKIPRAVIRRAFGYAKPYTVAIIAFLVATVLSSFLQVIPAQLLRRLLNHALPGRDRGEVTALALAAVGVAFGAALLQLAGRWFSARVGEGLIFDLRVSLFDHVQRMPIAFFTRAQTGALISRLNNDVVGAQQAVTITLGNIVSSLSLVVAVLVSMLAMEWRLTLLALGVIPLFLVASKQVGRRLQRLTREQAQLNAAMNTVMTERFNVSGALLAKLFGRPNEERDGFSGRAAGVRDIGVRLAMYMRSFFVVLGVVGAIGTAVVYWVGGRMVLSGTLEQGDIAAFAVLVTQLYPPLTLLTNARVDLMTAFVSFDRVFEILDLKHAIRDREGAQPIARPTGRLEFDAVWFRYPRGSEVSLASLEEGLASNDGEAVPGWVLRDVTLAIEPGTTVALVGASGAGKTTLSMLVPRIFDVTEGAVRIDGVDVRDVTQESLRSHVGFVTQDPHMFHDSIRNNLRYARPDATDEQIVAACKGAQIYDLIASLPDGLDTIVGERGYRLSGGEKQRLAIARMLLKDPAIIILDEATSHLDSESEALIQRALAAVLEPRTSIVIAHRLSTITGADEILVVDEGRIVERGRHAELLSRAGTYAELYETQFARAALEPSS
jgi:ATP-binding cassette subfamily B protein